MRIMVSYQLFGGGSDCGNWTFDTIEEAQKYIADNRHNWRSFHTFQYEEGHFITDLRPISI